jgi:hypothetical protein
MKQTINILVLSLILTAALAPAAISAAVICECPSKRCFSAGQWWPYCPECVCPGTTNGPEPYSQPVDSTFLKNNFTLNNDTLMQFIRDAFQSPLTQQQISDLLGQAGQPPSDGLPTYEIRSIYDSPYQYSMQEIKYDTIKLTANAKERQVLEDALRKGGGTPTLAGVPVDFRNLAAAMCAVQHGGLSETALQDKKLVGDIFDRFQENLEQMFPNAMKNLDEATTAKLYRDAVNEVKRGQ